VETASTSGIIVQIGQHVNTLKTFNFVTIGDINIQCMIDFQNISIKIITVNGLKRKTNNRRFYV